MPQWLKDWPDKYLLESKIPDKAKEPMQMEMLQSLEMFLRNMTEM